MRKASFPVHKRLNIQKIIDHVVDQVKNKDEEEGKPQQIDKQPRPPLKRPYSSVAPVFQRGGGKVTPTEYAVAQAKALLKYRKKMCKKNKNCRKKSISLSDKQTKEANKKQAKNGGQ